MHSKAYPLLFSPGLVETWKKEWERANKPLSSIPNWVGHLSISFFIIKFLVYTVVLIRGPAHQFCQNQPRTISTVICRTGSRPTKCNECRCIGLHTLKGPCITDFSWIAELLLTPIVRKGGPRSSFLFETRSVLEMILMFLKDSIK